MVTTLLLALCAPPSAEAIFVNGKIWTGEAARPEVAALAVFNGGVQRTGTNESVRELAGPDTKVIDLKGRRVVPGFNDSHLHFLGGGRLLGQVNLKDCKDEAEFGNRLKEFDAKMPKARWMLGGNWDHDRTFNGVLPTAELLDKYVKDRPVFIDRYDGHMAVVNTAALKLAGITADTKDPSGGVIERLADGKTPSGALKDNAMALVAKLIPEPDDAEILDAVKAAMKACSEQGVTTGQDMEGSNPPTRRKYVKLLETLGDRGDLTLRLDVRWPIGSEQEMIRFDMAKERGKGLVTLGGVKGFMDGSLGSSTAKMFEAFTSDSKTYGVWVTPPESMRNLVRAANDANLSVAIHAIGDEANAKLLDIFKEIAATKGKPGRFRIEHVQHLREADYPRFKELGVIASMQPYHVIDDGRWAEGRIGPARCSSSYAYRSLLDAGATIAFGSDWPVAPLNVLEGIDAAVNRRTLDGKHPGGWFPKQKITVAEAVTAYTAGSAAAGGTPKRGILKEGFDADFVVLDRDIFDPKEIDALSKTKVAMTVVAGKTVYEMK